MDKQYEVLNAQPLSDRFFKLHRYELRHSSFNGGWCEPIVRERLENLAAVSVLLFDPVEDALVLVEQFRVGMMGIDDPPWSLETVSGFCDIEHEQAQEVARREVLEETGCEVQHLTPIGSFFVSPGMSVEQIHLFVGAIDSTEADGVHGLEHEGEEIRVVVIPREQALEQLFGQLSSTSILIALQWLELNREALLDQWAELSIG